METQAKSYTWNGTTPSKEVIERAQKVQLLLMDVDGVMTDGKSYYIPDAGNAIFETKGFDAHDGLAFHLLNAAEIKTGALSGRKSRALQERADNLKFTYHYQGFLVKEPIFEEILAKAKLTADQVAYVGDDLTDVPLLKRVGLACSVANARPEVKTFSHFVTTAEGGHGAVREVAELLLKAQGKWEKALAKYQITL
jgi:3-deoxy-D-manno-octulosonate 8-phosphate phosphatase (KDO 8-P phosphatase)